eukprot:gnl/TRDRNA2_/TRDRNA2_186791_c0_seq1.p1 gnl/TRDRNA2_/TRDRNA2_186791_c0~~gnl/TRDRNA2_/TRDRNA2_186791_c0_seq1.p1  ORF type:complete len:196 (+),score=43.65 gnl/TRDRNA2_/TRDRNA2_186791_c0_seq1:39-626(+)
MAPTDADDAPRTAVPKRSCWADISIHADLDTDLDFGLTQNGGCKEAWAPSDKMNRRQDTDANEGGGDGYKENGGRNGKKRGTRGGGQQKKGNSDSKAQPQEQTKSAQTQAAVSRPTTASRQPAKQQQKPQKAAPAPQPQPSTKDQAPGKASSVASVKDAPKERPKLILKPRSAGAGDVGGKAVVSEQGRKIYGGS